MTTLKALETSLYWMTYVYKQTLDPVQRERVKTRIAKLEAEIAAHEDNQKVKEQPLDGDSLGFTLGETLDSVIQFLEKLEIKCTEVAP